MRNLDEEKEEKKNKEPLKHLSEIDFLKLYLSEKSLKSNIQTVSRSTCL